MSASEGTSASFQSLFLLRLIFVLAFVVVRDHVKQILGFAIREVLLRWLGFEQNSIRLAYDNLRRDAGMRPAARERREKLSALGVARSLRTKIRIDPI